MDDSAPAILREHVGPVALQVQTERWPFKSPFRITGHTWEALEVVLVTLAKEGRKGRGEAAGRSARSSTARRDHHLARRVSV